MSHTEGKLEYSEERPNCLLSGLRIMGTAAYEADARRLVACWNEHDKLVAERDRYDKRCEEMRESGIELIKDHSQRTLEALRLLQERDEALAALNDVLLYADDRTCSHDETHRGGAIWEICDMCGNKWADDEGGKPEWSEPPELAKARAILAKHRKGTDHGQE